MLRALAIIAAIWGFVTVSDAIKVAREAQKAAKANLDSAADAASNVTWKLASERVWILLFGALATVTVLLALAEGLKLCIAIEQHARAGGRFRSRDEARGETE
jgi:hypothetical protein